MPRPIRLFLLAVLVLFAGGVAHQSDAQPAKPKLCTLSDDNQTKAIAAFDQLMPVFHNDRCANCHTKIDPFRARGHVDVKESLKVFRDKNALAAAKGLRSSPNDLNEAHGAIVKFLDTGADDPTTRAKIMFSNACSGCHDAPPNELSWRMAPPKDSFHNKDRAALCRHIHQDSLTAPAHEFEKHMDKDEFIKVAFDGSRGLNGTGEAVFEQTTRSSFAKKPLRPQTHASMMASVRSWIGAQGGEYSDDPDCGCRPMHYALQIDEVWEGSLAGGPVSYNSRGQSGAKIPLKFGENGSFTGEGVVTIEMTHRGAGGEVQCDWTNTTDITWKVRGSVQDSGQIEIIGVQEIAPRAVSMLCQMPGGPRRFSRKAEGGRSEPVSLKMQAETGARVTIEKTWDMPQIKDTTILTLVEDAR